MENQNVQLNFNEYMAYLLLYAANADFEIEKKELQIIRKSLSREEYQKVRETFDNANDAERLGVIMQYKKVFIDVLIDTDAVIKQLKEVLHADDENESFEQGVFIFLKKLLQL